MRKWATSPWTAILTLLLVVGLRLVDPPFVESVRLRYFDTLIANKDPVENNIVVVNIDESALDKWGQWPFPRTVYAEIIQELYKRSAGLVVWDVIMPEKDRFNSDADFARTLLDHPVVLANKPGIINKNTPKRSGFVVLNSQFINQLTEYPGIIANIPELEYNAAGSGTIHTIKEIDGINRRVPLIIRNNSNLYPALSIEVLRVAAGDSTIQVKLVEGGVEKLRIPKFSQISTDNLGRVWIDWSQKSIQVSVTDLPKDLTNAIVVVGVSAAGIDNPVATAIGPVLPQNLQAAMIGTLINGVNIQRPNYINSVEILALVVVTSVLLFLTRWVYIGLIGVIIAMIAGISIGQFVFNEFLLLVDATSFTMGIALVSLHAYGIKFASEYLHKQQIKKQFAGYCSKEVVELLQKDPSLIVNGIKREVSICFSDLRGFTQLGESFGNDVRGLTAVMNGYMDAITGPVIASNGMIIKYIGDATMHIHNAPIEDVNHAATAVATGLNMVKAVEAYSKQLRARGLPGVKMGAGINTGLGYIGEMGSKHRHSYDILGDAVSLTARIEGKCKDYGCVLLVGENTVKLCENDFFFLKVDDLAVKGRNAGTGIYTVLDNVTDSYYNSRYLHNKMQQAYKNQSFLEAISMCEQLKDHFDGKMRDYYIMWIERCAFQKTQSLDKSWNGVFVAQTK